VRPASSERRRLLSGVPDGPSRDKRIRNLDGRDEDSHTARIFQALLEHGYSRNRPQSPSLAGAESSIKAFPRERNGFLGQTAHDVLGANVVHKISSASPLLNTKLNELEMPPQSIEAKSPFPSDVSSSQIAPLQIARQFAKKAASILETREVELLIDFLEKPRQIDREIANRVVRSRLDAFYQAEVAATGEPRERLAAPSGPEDAELGIILHCQSKEGHIGKFWDYESPSIQALTAKGLSSEFVYGFDWHWRAEESARRPGRSSCPASAWPRAKRSLHDALSSEILEILSLPWLIVGGACAKENYHRTLSHNSRLLSLSLSSTVNVEFELDIRETSVKRITTYVPHPSSGFFHPSFSSNYAVILDANISFFLWLHGKEDTRSFFTATQSTIMKGIPGAAPLQELYSYRQREYTLGRKLAENEYKSSFLSWAAKYLSARPSAILDRGESLANVIIKKIGDSISAKARDRRLKGVKARGLSNAGRKSAALRYGHTFKQFWDGESVRVTQKGVFKIFLSENQPSLELTGRKALYDLVKKYSNPVTIHFAEDEIVLKQGGQVVFQKSSGTVEDMVQRARWVEQIRLEFTKKGSTGLVRE